MKKFVTAAIAATLALAYAAGSKAAEYPTQPIRIVVGFSAGGTTDIIARLIGQELTQRWGQPVTIDNRPGAGGNLGADLVAKAKPDGYTLLMGSVGPLAVNASLYKNMPYDNLKDLTPITLVAHVPNMLVVNPKNVPAKTFDEFVAMVKANPGKYFFASTGSGTSSHLSGELLKVRAGIDMTHVPYKGAVALNDLIGGDSVHAMFATIPSVIGHVKAGTLRPLAVSSSKRSAGVPDVPTVAESGFPGFDASSWFGLVGPAGMPADIVDKIQKEVAAILNQPAMRQKFIEQGADPVASTPEEFAAYMRAETTKWAELIKISGAKAD